MQLPEGLTAEQRTTLTTLRCLEPRLDTLYELVQSFGQMVRQREGARLDAWVQQGADSQLAEVQRFARGLQNDKEAVLAGLAETYSNSIVEGFVNKLTLIKRQGYGQAGFALLRQRMLQPTNTNAS